MCGHVDRFGTESPKHLTRKFSGRSEAGPYPETVSLLTPVGEKPQVLVAESPSPKKMFSERQFGQLINFSPVDETPLKRQGQRRGGVSNLDKENVPHYDASFALKR